MTAPASLTRSRRVLLGTFGVVAVLAAGEVAGRAGLVQRAYLPPSSEVVERAVRLAGDPLFLDGVGATLGVWAYGLLLGCAVAVPLGVLFGSVPKVDAAARAVVEFLRPIPSVALIPLVALLLGTGGRMQVTVIAYACVWPVLFNTVYGLGDVDPVAKDSLRAFGFGRLQVLWRVVLPATAPFVAAGVRISAAVALILAVASEILSGFGEGLGTFIAQAAQIPDGTTDVLAGTLWAGVLGLTVNALLGTAERRLMPWARAR
ncbi:ABC transporter permease [Streptomyces boluensis]|uniref:ABC transporter permease subunit n=1 Tax=Streptomyces boluensis TaxID=1775135 RepID=A0A964XRL0_9ACTN|nr:ABC transporter permease [Streptomyces boluensis]NBE56888.1 ABC transporter permease subunit [Streptomyces boluensis]